MTTAKAILRSVTETRKPTIAGWVRSEGKRWPIYANPTREEMLEVGWMCPRGMDAPAPELRFIADAKTKTFYVGSGWVMTHTGMVDVVGPRLGLSSLWLNDMDFQPLTKNEAHLFFGSALYRGSRRDGYWELSGDRHELLNYWIGKANPKTYLKYMRQYDWTWADRYVRDIVVFIRSGKRKGYS